MPSFFDQIEAVSQAAVTSIFGDVIRIIPRSGDLNYGGGNDGSRQPVEVAATFSSAPTVVATDYPGTQRNGAETIMAPSEIWIDRAVVVSIPYALRKGDHIVLIGAPGAPKFTVLAAEPGDHGDVRVTLTK